MKTKKIVIRLATLALSTSLIFTSCKKEDITNENTTEITTRQLQHGLVLKNNILSFETEEMFEKIVNDLHDIESLDKWEKTNGFISYRTASKLEAEIKAYENKEESHPFSDLPLATVINESGIVEIERWVFRFNVSQRQIAVLENTNISEVALFIKGENTANTKHFNFDDDIWGELKNDGTSDEITTKAKCKEKSSSSTELRYNGVNWNEYGSFTQNDKTYRFHVHVKERYDNWGVYRKLYTEFKHKESYGGWSDITSFSIGYEFSYKVKCKSKYGSDNNYIPTGVGSPLTPTSYDYTDEKKTIEHYKGTRALTTFSLKSWATYQQQHNLQFKYIPNSLIGVLTHKH